MGNGFVDPVYAKTDSYADELARIESTGGCPFCVSSASYTLNPDIQPELFRNQHWFIVPVRKTKAEDWTYRNSQHHYMIIAIRHVEHFRNLSVDELHSLTEAQRWIIDFFDCEGGAFAMRFGSSRMTGASVSHLHCHFIEPEMDSATKRAMTVFFPIG